MMKQRMIWPKQALFVFCALITNTAYCQLTASYNDRACLGFQVLTCQGTGNTAEWRVFPSGADFIVVEILSSSFRAATITLGIGVETATATFNGNIQSGNFTSMLFISITEGLEGASVSCRDSRNRVIGTHIIRLAGVPSAPQTFLQVNRPISSSSVDVIIGWDAPNNTNGAEIVNYAVTIFPLAQLSVNEVSSTIVTVAGINYNTEYTVRVMASNCIGQSLAGEFVFKVGRCPIPVAPISGSISSVDIGERLVGSTVAFQCGQGFEPSGLVTATCSSTLTWSPNPTTFECAQTSTQNAAMFTTVQLVIGVVVALVLSAIFGIAVGVCGTYLIKCKRSTTAMHQMNRPTEPAEYEEVGLNTWTIGINTAYSTAK